MTLIGRQVLEQLSRLLQFSPDASRPNTMLAPKLTQFNQILALIFDIVPPARSSSKRLNVEFLAQNYQMCCGKQPVWSRDSDNQIYRQLAAHFNVDLQKTSHPQSPFYDVYAHVGTYAVSDRAYVVKFALEQQYLDILKRHQSANIVCYVTGAALPMMICNGMQVTQTLQPYVLYMANQQTNLIITDKQSCQISIYLAKTLSTRDMFSVLMKKPLISSAKLARALKKKNFVGNITTIATNEDEDGQELEVETETISLTSYLQKAPIRYPVRSNLCRHFDRSMDLEELLQDIKAGKDWRCCVCGQAANWSQLYVDAFAYHCILQGYTGQVVVHGDDIEGEVGAAANEGEESEQDGWGIE